uniref:Gem-associated protein 7 n=2 Tax=Parascaris univalens TaxID=6257 RepID=A0A914ZE11_PARUN
MADEQSTSALIEQSREESDSTMSDEEMRGELRERYLRMISSLGGKQVTVDMHEKTRVSGKFVAMKSDGSHFAVDSLSTPLGVIEHAILRMGDTLCITAKLDAITDDCLGANEHRSGCETESETGEAEVERNRKEALTEKPG